MTPPPPNRVASERKELQYLFKKMRMGKKYLPYLLSSFILHANNTKKATFFFVSSTHVKRHRQSWLIRMRPSCDKLKIGGKKKKKLPKSYFLSLLVLSMSLPFDDFVSWIEVKFKIINLFLDLLDVQSDLPGPCAFFFFFLRSNISISV